MATTKLLGVRAIYVDFVWADESVPIMSEMIWHTPVYGLQKLEWEATSDDGTSELVDWTPPVKYMGYMG